MMSKEARDAYNAYRREKYKQNPQKQREYSARYWERRAAGLVRGVRDNDADASKDAAQTNGNG